MRQKIKDILTSCRFSKEYVAGMEEILGADYYATNSNRTRTVVEYYETLLAIVATFDAGTELHLNSSAQIAEYLGIALSFSEFELVGLSLGSLMHDIGKIGIDREIITRPSPITADERTIIETHTTIGASIISYIQTPWNLKKYALMHHERLDGTGYPNRLTADQIPTDIRILTIADVTEALTAKRPYRTPWTIQQVLDYLNSHPEWFDVNIVKHLENFKFQG
jgi:HD-GYP domain-containing protein (c-di-GMP phosphodiesterase class II)